MQRCAFCRKIDHELFSIKRQECKEALSTDLVAGERPLEVAAVVSPALLEEPLVAAGAVAVVVALRLGDEVVVQNLETWRA